MKKRSEETQKNWEKRFERKKAEGIFGKFISWFDFMRDKKELTMKDFDTYNTPFGRIGNKVYECSERTNFKFVLYKKCKNATKAKKFMETL
jgi:hypothetical protein